MGELSKLPNIGPVVEKQLNEVGINTYEELEKIGSRKAWLMIKENDPTACIHRLLALEGAIKKIKKTQLPEEEKKSLKKFYDDNKSY